MVCKLPMPFETIKNFPVLKHSSNKKLLVIKPDETLIIEKFNFLIICKL